MLNERQLLELTLTHMKSVVERVGVNAVETVVEDFLAFGSANSGYQPARVGHNYEFAGDIAAIIAGLQLFVTIWDIWKREANKHDAPKSPIFERIKIELVVDNISHVTDIDVAIHEVITIGEQEMDA